MSKQKDYFFNVYHRNISVNEEIQKEVSPGHFYLMLESGFKQSFFGKYPKNTDSINLNLIAGESKISTEDEKVKHQKIEEYLEQNPSENILCRKTAPLNKEEYKHAFSYAVSKCEGTDREGIYIIGMADCSDFVQAVYHAAGLPLNFTILYTREELKVLDSWAATHILLKYASRDTFKFHFRSIEAPTREQLAEGLNIGVDKIEVNESLNVFMLPTFRVDTKKVLREFQERFGYELSDSEEEEVIASQILSANKVINGRVNHLLSNPEALKEHQTASLNEAFAELKLADQIIPGLSEQSLAFAAENHDLMQQFMGHPTIHTATATNFAGMNFGSNIQNNDLEEDPEFYANLGVIPD
jgi:hypothetical protein